MKATTKLAVAEPCHENWNAMSTAEQGKFCHACQKTVTDFTQMSDKEILDYISLKGSKMCGRFESKQLDRVLYSEPNQKFRWAYVWNFAVAGLLTIFQANAQVVPGKATKNTGVVNVDRNVKGEFSVEMKIPSGLKELSGTIIDSSTNQPIPYATVKVKGTASAVTSNEKGEFTIKLLFHSKEMVLQVSSVGYFEQEFTVTAVTNKVSFYLQPVNVIPVEDINMIPPFTEPVMMGIMIARKEVPIKEKVSRKVLDKLPALIQTKYLKVYPNPVDAGTSFRVEFNKIAESNYSLQVLDASGRIFHIQNLELNTQVSTITIDSDETWAKGVYWVRLESTSTRKVYSSKLIIR